MHKIKTVITVLKGIGTKTVAYTMGHKAVAIAIASVVVVGSAGTAVGVHYLHENNKRVEESASSKPKKETEKKDEKKEETKAEEVVEETPEVTEEVATESEETESSKDTTEKKTEKTQKAETKSGSEAPAASQSADSGKANSGGNSGSTSTSSGCQHEWKEFYTTVGESDQWEWQHVMNTENQYQCDYCGAVLNGESARLDHNCEGNTIHTFTVIGTCQVDGGTQYVKVKEGYRQNVTLGRFCEKCGAVEYY